MLASGVELELRTTYHPALITDGALLALARELRALGASSWVLQRWRPTEGAAADLSRSWHWPDAALLDALRAQGPALQLR